VSVAEPPFQPSRDECQECGGDGIKIGTTSWWDTGETDPCPHCYGTGKCDCRVCRDLRP
jgi:DnaJ-class molecular chaperone